MTRTIVLVGVVVTGIAFVLSSPARSAESEWTMPDAYRDIQHITLQTQRDLLERLIDSIPSTALRVAVTAEQRDFAEQIHHVAGLNAVALARVLGVAPPVFPDTSVALTSKAGLRQIVSVGFDWMDSLLTAQSSEVRHERIRFAGREIYTWQLFDEMNEHSLWVAGQVVANFRALGMAPPQFRFF